MSSTALNPYDEVPYIGHAYAATHPDRLAVMGTLLGLRPAPVTGCRVLELGCGDGGNLLPMAYTLPGSRFYGIDLAVKPVAQGNVHAAELGLSNLRLEAMDIMDFPGDAGEFDYIISHGIFSWVPAFVREKMFAICAAHLAPQGIAYISYKVFPGSYVTDTIHQMMRFEAGRRPGLSEEGTVRAGLDLMRTVVKSQPELDAYRGNLNWRLGAIDQRMAAYGGYSWVYHDMGVEISDPLYFYQFMEQAARHGLQFLSEPTLDKPVEARYTPETVAVLDALGDDVVAREQYDDFLSNREFRRTLLCRADAAVDRSLDPGPIYALNAAAPMQPMSQVGADGDPLAKEEFAAPGGKRVTVDQPVVKEAFRLLGRIWPRPASFGEMLAATGAGDAATRPEDANRLASTLLSVFRADMINLLTCVPAMATAVSERPVASARLRQQIACGRPILTNLTHVEVEVKDLAVRQFLSMLDGTRDRAAMLRDLGDWLDQNRAEVPELPTREWLAGNIDTVLSGFVRQQFLVA